MTTLNVNGIPYEIEADIKTPLLWVLRDIIGLTGTKYGCGIGQCRACLVLLQGEAKKSCKIKLEEASGEQITTIEGLSSDVDNPNHPLQVAWIEHQVPQCGFCQSGMIMGALKKYNEMIVEEGKTNQGDKLANGLKNICICGTQQRIKNALRSL